MLASLIFDAVLSIPAEPRKKPISILCTGTVFRLPFLPPTICHEPTTASPPTHYHFLIFPLV
jgi:hypothetical protein